MAAVYMHQFVVNCVYQRDPQAIPFEVWQLLNGIRVLIHHGVTNGGNHNIYGIVLASRRPCLDVGIGAPENCDDLHGPSLAHAIPNRNTVWLVTSPRSAHL